MLKEIKLPIDACDPLKPNVMWNAMAQINLFQKKMGYIVYK
jgi:hypothetical protein